MDNPIEEFTTVTLRQPPLTAEVLKKSSSYPDFHGDYCSCSLIKLSQQDYTKLYDELLKDNAFTNKVELTSSAEFTEVMSNYKPEQIKFSFERKIPWQEDHYLYIGFLKDQRSIVVHVCIS